MVILAGLEVILAERGLGCFSTPSEQLEPRNGEIAQAMCSLDCLLFPLLLVGGRVFMTIVRQVVRRARLACLFQWHPVAQSLSCSGVSSAALASAASSASLYSLTSSCLDANSSLTQACDASMALASSSALALTSFAALFASLLTGSPLVSCVEMWVTDFSSAVLSSAGASKKLD